MNEAVGPSGLSGEVGFGANFELGRSILSLPTVHFRALHTAYQPQGTV